MNEEKITMRVIPATIVAALLLAGAGYAQAAAPQITCAQIPDAQRFVDGLKPGPNTSAAQQHLDAAKRASDAGDDRHCVSELSRVNYYARRSAAADKRSERHLASASAPVHRRHVLCADAMHQDRPGGSDYHGPAVAGCRRVL
ncbi:MAG TPA: hypothetical protein VGP48_07310 [Stellaceae bacterium]|jgi:hypothetical protein|nr:hypothetical protein [Stellaceae bacterium]